MTITSERNHKINESARVNGGLLLDNTRIEYDTSFIDFELLDKFNRRCCKDTNGTSSDLLNVKG